MAAGAHAACAERADDFIRAETRACYERHGLRVNFSALAAGPHSAPQRGCRVEDPAPQRELTLMRRCRLPMAASAA